MKAATARARRERAKPMFKAAHSGETTAGDINSLREGKMLTPSEKAVLLHAEEMMLRAGKAVRRIALRLHESRAS